MINNNTIPFTKFAKNFFEKSGGTKDLAYQAAPEDNSSTLKSKKEYFKDFLDSKRNIYTAVMSALTVDLELLKVDDNLHVPTNQQDKVEWIINNYKSSTSKHYRKLLKKVHDKSKKMEEKNEQAPPPFSFFSTKIIFKDDLAFKEESKMFLENVNTEDFKTLINNVACILEAQLEGDEQRQELNNLYRNTFYLFKETYEHLKQDSLSFITAQVEYMMTPSETGFQLESSEKTFHLNYADQITLLRQYMYNINEVNNRFVRLTKIAKELRDEELQNLEDDDLDEKKQVKDLWLRLSDFNDIIEKAKEIDDNRYENFKTRLENDAETKNLMAEKGSEIEDLINSFQRRYD